MPLKPVFEITPIYFHIRQHFDDTLKILAMRASQKQLELSSQIDPELTNEPYGDAARLQQIVVNLVEKTRT